MQDVTGPYVLGLDEIGEAQRPVVGGKAANLAELRRLDGVDVPDGCCMTTHAYDRVVADSPALRGQLERLARLRPADTDAIAQATAEIRGLLETAGVPDEIVRELAGQLHRLGEGTPYAVRSSATAEDLPTASFAGQQDSYLDVAGLEEIVRRVRGCWASLFTERAVVYRLRNGFDHRRVRMAVVVQRMVPARAAGVLFTADPVTSDRRVVAIEAVAGLGEALVSGAATPDTYRVRDGAVVSRAIAGEARPVLTDADVLGLAELGRRIEAHLGTPQDVEWALADGVSVVQSRPITTLFPVPEAPDGGFHVYLSVGHAQMMTDAMKPLGLSFWQMTTPRPMAEAGGRLFADATPVLATAAGRAYLLGSADPLTGDALRTLIDRGAVPPLPEGAPPQPAPAPPTVEVDPAVVPGLIRRSEESIAALKRDIAGRHGDDLFAFLLDDLQELRRILFDPESLRVITAGFDGVRRLDEQLREELGEPGAVDALTQSVPHNVTSEMGLALLDVADAVRPHPAVVAFLERVEAEHPDGSGFLDDLAGIPGGAAVRDAFRAFLDRYGMRCPGEIDITRPRWSERPAALVPAVLGNVRSFAPGEAARRFEQGLRRARETEHELVERLRARPDGEAKAREIQQLVERVRAIVGYREYPKYGMVSRYLVYKQALLAEAARLVRAGVLAAAEDVSFLRFEEFREVVRTGRVDPALVGVRKAEFEIQQALTPPRVLTSDGEVLDGSYRRDDLPEGALPGLAVSAGTVEGRARVVVDLERADVVAGDILVTRGTDPSWTPLFLTVAGLVTEVGGLLTHGAVIAREYGLPAVVGVQEATRLIRDGQRIRVHGSEGYVEVLSGAVPTLEP